MSELHECPKQSEKRKRTCKFAWGELGTWCGKIVKCRKCGKKVNPYLMCLNESGCKYYERRRWYNIFDGYWGNKKEYLEHYND